MALLLNLETATTNCSISIAEDGRLLALREQNSAQYSHAEQLHPFIEAVMDELGLSLSNLDAVAVSKGPGSYTGLRIGVSAAKGLCFALGIPLISVATLESMVQEQKDGDASFLIPLLDARRMEVYSAVFDAHGNCVRNTEAEIITEASFATFSAQGKVLLLGSGAEKCRGVVAHENIHIDSSVVPSAKEMAALSYHKWMANDLEDVAYFEPYYLKDFVLQGKGKKG
ncbi:tRNA (adenosine(37)-N6)-threonylcarbamoyltransferase complex dimerization subunit type 1 TsaB [Maribacter sp. 2-571]|uniref:tRNA (adenosine(37)-N6)-threonylcarbamoyltransferase complex dimerization subunit type 1 TsaB n=1 Tax=Maribacter sp. 2-571 TaxID=3417569 RepID=UPI003D33729C